MIDGLTALYFAVEKAPSSIPKVPVTDATIANVFNAALGFAGALAVVFIVYGGIQYVMSQGDSSKVSKAKDSILYAVIGLIIVIFAFTIVNFVIGKF